MMEFGYRFGFGQAGLVTPGFLLRDTFTDTENTVLAAHAMNVGPGWVIADGAFKINANSQAQATSIGASEAKAAAIAESGTPDVSVACNVYTGTSNGAGLNVRHQDNNNFWNASLSVTSGELRIFQVEAGIVTQRAQVALTLAMSTWYTLHVAANGDVLTASVGAASCTYTSAFNNNQTRHGIRALATTHAFDNFEVTA